jgi:uncharacterized protein (DUF1810 family)
MNDSFDLQRFVDAPAAIYLWIVEELLRDENRHTGCDSLCRRSSVLVSVPWLNASLGTRAEAVAYLEDGLLGPRLVECTRLVHDAFRRPLEAVNLCGSRRRLLCRREGPCDFRNSGNEPTPYSHRAPETGNLAAAYLFFQTNRNELDGNCRCQKPRKSPSRTAKPCAGQSSRLSIPASPGG